MRINEVASMLQSTPKTQRTSVNTSIDSQLIKDAKALGINISRPAEAGIAKAIAAEKTRRWQEENKDAIESSNEYVTRNGLPLAKHRPFLMARYDFYQNTESDGYLLDVQSDILEGLNTRVVVPLMQPQDCPASWPPTKPDLRYKRQKSCDGHTVYVGLQRFRIAGPRGKPFQAPRRHRRSARHAVPGLLSEGDS